MELHELEVGISQRFSLLVSLEQFYDDDPTQRVIFQPD